MNVLFNFLINKGIILAENIERELNPGLYVLITIFACLVISALIYLLFRSIKKEEKRFRDEELNVIDGLMSKSEMVADINAYIAKSAVVEFHLLYVDIDGFSNVVDAFGKDASNKILEKIAYSILDVLPNRVELARISEDKFMVFVRGEYERKDVKKLANLLLDTVSKPITILNDAVLNLSASIGVAYYPTHGKNVKELMQSLELVVYTCKRDGGNMVRIYNAETGAKESENYEYYHQIKDGIKNKEFTIYYQPIIDAKDDKIFGFEGLMRWNHPELGVLSPYKFINIMEQTGDINWVGIWGLETIANQYLKLKKVFPKEEFCMSLNLSPRQLTNPSLASDFQKVIKKYHVPAQSIMLEIEEFAIFEKQETVKKNLTSLNDLGFLIAVDGFGLDYEALSRLSNSPVKAIKLDNSYLEDDENSGLKGKVVDMLVNYTRFDNMHVISEGIEDGFVLNKAKEFGINMFQGYHFSKPFSEDEIEDYISKKSWKAKLDAAAALEEQEAKDEQPAFENNELLEVEEEKEENISNEILEESKESEENAEVIKEAPKKAKKEKKAKAPKEEAAIEEIPEEKTEAVEEVNEELDREQNESNELAEGDDLNESEQPTEEKQAEE